MTKRIAPVVSLVDSVRLAASAECDPRTARRWLQGEDVKGESLTLRLQLAASTLGLRRRKPRPSSEPHPVSTRRGPR